MAVIAAAAAATEALLLKAHGRDSYVTVVGPRKIGQINECEHDNTKRSA